MMDQQMDYQILSSSSPVDLSWNINEKLKLGFICQGGVLVREKNSINRFGDCVYYQAIILIKDKDGN